MKQEQCFNREWRLLGYQSINLSLPLMLSRSRRNFQANFITITCSILKDALVEMETYLEAVSAHCGI